MSLFSSASVHALVVHILQLFVGAGGDGGNAIRPAVGQ